MSDDEQHETENCHYCGNPFPASEVYAHEGSCPKNEYVKGAL